MPRAPRLARRSGVQIQGSAIAALLFSLNSPVSSLNLYSLTRFARDLVLLLVVVFAFLRLLFGFSSNSDSGVSIGGHGLVLKRALFRTMEHPQVVGHISQSRCS